MNSQGSGITTEPMSMAIYHVLLTCFTLDLREVISEKKLTCTMPNMKIPRIVVYYFDLLEYNILLT